MFENDHAKQVQLTCLETRQFLDNLPEPKRSQYLAKVQRNYKHVGIDVPDSWLGIDREVLKALPVEPDSGPREFSAPPRTASLHKKCSADRAATERSRDRGGGGGGQTTISDGGKVSVERTAVGNIIRRTYRADDEIEVNESLLKATIQEARINEAQDRLLDNVRAATPQTTVDHDQVFAAYEDYEKILQSEYLRGRTLTTEGDSLL